VSTILEFELGEFTWTGSDELPDTVEGEDHAWLILNLVDGTNASGQEVGLNNPNSELNSYIEDRLDGGWGWERDYFGSMAVTGGNNVENIFGTKATGVSFLIEVVSDLEYYIYTTSVYLGERGEINFWGTSNKTPGKPSVPIGEYIYAVYKTKLTRRNTSSDWEIIETKKGKAKSDWYDENRSAANATQIPCFDKDTWVEAEMGGTPTEKDAIWTFIGDNPTAYATQSMPTVYYRIKPSSAGTITASSDNEKVRIDILSSTGAQVATSGENSSTVSFTASANTLYYIAVTGDDIMNLIIS
ncbi:MAG: hypothetical protein J6R29_02800, partial [Clostridia bacterium]|nr:hypothetical protein [Clostridia bacterium]